jgi:O-acetyl-ADP-ribose deacetylase (regulator of RNase III)
MEHRIHGSSIRLTQGDITEQDADAIVNPANPSLMGGGGVDGAIHRKGGSQILHECLMIRRRQHPEGLTTGGAVITTGGRLKARHVIHTVGPIWRGGTRGEPALLALAHTNSLRLAEANRLKTIAFPAISTGAYGYPIEKAARIAITTVREFLEKTEDNLEVIFVLYTAKDLETYRKVAREILIPP